MPALDSAFQELTINDLVKERIVTTGVRPSIEKPNAITCMCGESEMLKVSDKGFWVRGIKVEQDANEAKTVYEAFKAWMIWAQMTKDYK